MWFKFPCLVCVIGFGVSGYRVPQRDLNVMLAIVLAVVVEASGEYLRVHSERLYKMMSRTLSVLHMGTSFACKGILKGFRFAAQILAR